MANETSILAVLANLQAENQENNEQFVYNQDKLIGELQQKNASTSSLAITIVSLVGSFLAVLAFIGFLILGGIYDSTAALLILGFGFVAASVAINEVYNKPLLDTASVSVFASGIAIVAAGLEKMHISSDNIVVSIGSIALFTLLLSRSYILLFVSTIIASSSALWLIEVHRSLDFLPLYNSVMVAILASSRLATPAAS